MAKSALITGITGQDGTYLAELLISKGYTVHGLVRGQHNPKMAAIQKLIPKLELIEGDLYDQSSLMSAIEAAEPDEVYNLGAISYVALSFKQAINTGEITALGVTRLLEAIRVVNPKIRFYQASSSEMFGKVRETPQTEMTAFHPRSPYGVAKAYGHYLTVNYRESYGMFACSGILFNHESPRRGPEFVTRKISKAVARIKLGLQDSLVLGTLDSKRDWGFAGDYVSGMHLMLQQDQPDDYVLATGETHSVREFCELAFGHAGLEWEKYTTTDATVSARPAEVDLLIGDATKAKEKLGWTPTVTFPELVNMMVDSDIAAEEAAVKQAQAVGA
jgi:GDPmannose 4,6-dehydratase